MTCPHCGNNVADQNKFCPKCGGQFTATPYTPPSYQAPPAFQAQPAWQMNAQPPRVKRKSRVGKVLLIVGIVLVVLVSGLGVAIYFGVKSYVRSTRSSEPYALAESTLRESQRVKEKMGEITNIGVPLGTFKEEPDGTGFAAYVMTVQGEKAGGQYIVAMYRKDHTWRVQSAKVQLHSGEEIKVVDEKNPIPSYGDPDTETNSNNNQNTNTENSNNSAQKATTVNGGVLNGKAISLPKPAYPATAKAAHASGTVVVQVTLDEEGKVIVAKAVSGHPLLHASAESAARQARFTPTKLAGKPVKVTGVITYNFEPEP